MYLDVFDTGYTNHKVDMVEEFDAVASRLAGQRNLKRVAKTIYGMAALSGLESPGQSSAEAAAVVAATDGTCVAGDEIKANNSETFWLWFELAFMLVLWVTFAVVAYKVFKKLRNDLEQFWGQVADEDSYIAVQAGRIDTLSGKVDMMDGRLDELEDRVTETSNEVNMTHD